MTSLKGNSLALVLPMAKIAASPSLLIHNHLQSIFFVITLTFVLMFASAARCASINPTLNFQQDAQHLEYNQLAQVILKEAYRRIGQPIKTLSSQLGEQQSYPKDGILIAPADAYIKADYIRIPIAIVRLKVFAYAHKKNSHTRYEFGLLGNRIAIVRDMPMIKNNMMGMIALQQNSVNTSFQSILRNQIDLALLPEFSALRRASKHLRAHVVALQPAVYEVPMYHYVNKKHQHLIGSLMRSLKDMKKQQLIAQVTRSYKVVLAADAEA
ncbi:MAG: polar amino acid transport system substrate-binding protein [Oleispira sp.]|jgi:polar amino acid transport system substrate-binding protein